MICNQTTEVEKMDFFPSMTWNANAIFFSADSIQEIPGFLAEFENIV